MNKAIEIKDRLVEIFSTKPEVSEILLFGKIAENKADRYSDIDIKIISNDPYKTQSTLHKNITQISSIRETFTIVSNENCFAEMIMLKDYEPYQKIDISDERDGFGINFANTKSVYNNKKATGKNKDLVIFPTNKTCDHNLMSFLFSVPRITKCFFRKDFDMYRRWKDMTDAICCLLFESYFGWQAITQNKDLNAPDSKKLFESLSQRDKEKLQGIMPLNGIVSIPKSFLVTLEWFIELSRSKASYQKIYLNEDFNKYITDFAKKEINKL